jgi:hypothetical protein
MVVRAIYPYSFAAVNNSDIDSQHYLSHTDIASHKKKAQIPNTKHPAFQDRNCKIFDLDFTSQSSSLQ